MAQHGAGITVYGSGRLKAGLLLSTASGSGRLKAGLWLSTASGLGHLKAGLRLSTVSSFKSVECSGAEHENQVTVATWVLCVSGCGGIL